MSGKVDNTASDTHTDGVGHHNVNAFLGKLMNNNSDHGRTGDQSLGKSFPELQFTPGKPSTKHAGNHPEGHNKKPHGLGCLMGQK